jgi:hypothetical protein
VEGEADRFAAGEVTHTDVGQAESSLASGRAQLTSAESNYITSRANYRQIIGVEPPARLAPGAPVDQLSPRTVEGAVGSAGSSRRMELKKIGVVDLGYWADRPLRSVPVGPICKPLEVCPPLLAGPREHDEDYVLAELNFHNLACTPPCGRVRTAAFRDC